MNINRQRNLLHTINLKEIFIHNINFSVII